MTKAASSNDDVASRAWSAMRTFVAAHERRREIQEAFAIGRGYGRVKLLLFLMDGPMTLSEIAEATGVDAPYATVVVDKLEGRGWVQRTAHPDDHRRKLVKLTAAGRRASALASEILAEPPSALAALSPEDAATLERIMTLLESPE
jgi:DNA-binding MarR family transcriptional regulator